MAGDMFVVGIVYNLAIIEVSGRRCGRICMRMCMYDLSTPTYIHIICR